jgi:hypothetical protein
VEGEEGVGLGLAAVAPPGDAGDRDDPKSMMSAYSSSISSSALLLLFVVCICVYCEGTRLTLPQKEPSSKRMDKISEKRGRQDNTETCVCDR